MKFIIAMLVVFASASSSSSQHHAQYHNSYQSWVNNDNKGCCNNADCDEIKDEKVREEGGKIEVFVEGVGVATGQSAWCPVLHSHYLKKGNAPNWSSAHACITGYYGGTTPCAQFICFQPKPGT